MCILQCTVNCSVHCRGGREDSIFQNNKPVNWTSLYSEIYSTVYSTVYRTGKVMLYSAIYSTVNSKLYTIQFSNTLQDMKKSIFQRLGQLSKTLQCICLQFNVKLIVEEAERVVLMKAWPSHFDSRILGRVYKIVNSTVCNLLYCTVYNMVYNTLYITVQQQYQREIGKICPEIRPFQKVNFVFVSILMLGTVYCSVYSVVYSRVYSKFFSMVQSVVLCTIYRRQGGRGVVTQGIGQIRQPLYSLVYSTVYSLQRTAYSTVYSRVCTVVFSTVQVWGVQAFRGL